MNIQKGNPYTALLTFTDSDGGAYDLTGKTILFALKLTTDTADDDSNALVTKTITVHTNAAAGQTILELSATDTLIDVKRAGYYKADFRIYESGAVQSNTTTIYPTITDIVTKRTS